MKTLRPSCKKCVLFELTLEMFKEAGITVPEGFEGISDDCDAFTSVDADVVPVVRCKDCKHAKFMASCSRYMCHKVGGSMRYSNDYCNYGKKKQTKGE